MSQPKSSGGLKGIIAGDSAIATVGLAGKGLNYRGYPIEELAEHSTYEEVLYLMLFEKLPSKGEYFSFWEKLWGMRTIPEALKKILEQLPKEAHPMDITRTICSVIGILEPEKPDFSNQIDCTLRLVAVFGPAILYWYHFANSGIRIKENTGAHDSIAANFMKILTLSDKIDEEYTRAFDISLILYAEHDFAASTFAARVTTSTMADLHSAITTGIATLKGNLHGGANEAVLQYLKDIHTIQEADEFLNKKFSSKSLIMGFGHRVYKYGDPRHIIIKKWSERLTTKPFGNKNLHAIASHIEERMVKEKKIDPNLDYFAACTYYQLNIPVLLYTPIFVISRTSGWAAHVFEQRANNKLIRPSSQYTGPDTRKYPHKL